LVYGLIMAKTSGKKSIIALRGIVKRLPAKKREVFERFYAVEESTGRMKIPRSMKKWIKENFRSVEKVESQKIVHISNRFTGEGTLFNELRASRPFDTACNYNLNLNREDSCHFCSMEECTPHEHFGRIKGKYCTTASNIAKYDYFHGLVIFKEHNPLRLKKEWLKDYLKTSEKWFREAENLNCKVRNRF
jgi:hypothetical protein